MRIFVCVLISILLFSGCNKSHLETLGDPCAVSTVNKPAQLCIKLPDGQSNPVLAQDNKQLYLFEDLEIAAQTLPGGDLAQTFLDSVGYSIEDLTVIETKVKGLTRYDSVCSVLGEGQEQVVRIVIIDDGLYHYVVTAAVTAEQAEACLADTNYIVDSLSLSTDQ